MQISWILIILGSFVIAAIIRIITNRKAKLTAPCPQCKSPNVLETNRETTDTRSIQRFWAGTGAGADIRLQLDMDLTFRCQNCGHKFTRNFTQTQ